MIHELEDIQSAYQAEPGEIRAAFVRDGTVYEWAGGPVAIVPDVWAAELLAASLHGSLPWGLVWLTHDDGARCFYVIRVAEGVDDGE